MQVGFEYTFLKYSDIFEASPKISELTSMNHLEVWGYLFFIIFCTLCLFPYIFMKQEEKKVLQKKEEKRNLLEQLILQKQIEEEVEKEIEIEDEKKFQK